MGVSASRAARRRSTSAASASSTDQPSDGVAAAWAPSSRYPPSHSPPEGRSWTPSLPPPEDPSSCPVLEAINADVYEAVFDMLPAEDIAAFARTSKQSKGVVDTYVAHSVSKGDGIYALRHFLNTNPLTLKELLLKRRLERLSERKGEAFVGVVHLFGVRAMSERYGAGRYVKREHVYDADSFPHLGNPSYIVRQFDDHLNREVVHLRTVCWLHFLKTFEDVPKGRYRVSLRMRVLKNFRWGFYHSEGDDEEGTTLFVEAIRGEEVTPLITQMVSPAVWEAMGKKRSSGNPASLPPPAKISFDSTSSESWAWVHMPPFDLEEASNIRFQFKDIDNAGWKSGMEWDFVQLASIES